jgi:type IV pilus assembly protein PilX
MKPVYRHAQRGAVLIVALLFLTILTILGVTAMTATTFEERMAGNTRDLSLAFQAADAALRDARRDLNGIVIPPFPAAGARDPKISGKTGFGSGADVDDGKCGTSTAPGSQFLGLCRPFPYDSEKGIQPKVNPVLDSESVVYGRFTGAPMPVSMLSRKPQYFIEILCYLIPGTSIGAPPTEACAFYRITAKGYGGNINTQVTLQEIFLKP